MLKNNNIIISVKSIIIFIIIFLLTVPMYITFAKSQGILVTEIFPGNPLTINYPWSVEAFENAVNKERLEFGLKPLKNHPELNKIAEKRLDDMIANNYFAHESPTGNDVDRLLVKSNYKHKFRGENLAYGEFYNEEDVVEAWMNSKWHRYNILYKNFKEVGTAVRVVDYMGGKYMLVAQIFGAR